MSENSNDTTQSFSTPEVDREERLAILLERWEDDVARGNSPTPAAIAVDFPELASDLERILLRLGKVASRAGSFDPKDPIQEFMTNFRVGRYSPVALRGQGGQGWIFEVQDGELPRRAALKCLRPFSAADSGARSRLALEAKIISKLEHPGIVPIYSLAGEQSDNPYYAMRLVDNEQTLRNAIDELHRVDASGQAADRFSKSLRELLRRFDTVCQTVAYAHSRGIIHRDLKPGNIMLDRFGVTLVIDWGLAKEIGTTAEDIANDPARESLRRLSSGDGQATLAGVALGTPAYMSPEQANGRWDQVGPASDIYSLGATLYTLLTGVVPFAESSADIPCDMLEVLKRVKAGESPRAPRKVLSSVPAPLEAICLKAMAPQPERRYATALELAVDIEKYLDDEPVGCWTEPLSIRVRRWVRRHHTFMVGAAAALLVAIVSTSAFAVRERRQNEELTQANARITRYATIARGTTRDLAAFAVGDPKFSNAVLTIITADVPESTAKGLEIACDSLRKLVAETPDDIESLRDLASLSQLLGIVQGNLGRRDDALRTLDQASQCWADVRRFQPNDLEAQGGEAVKLMTIARLHVLPVTTDAKLFNNAQILENMKKATPLLEKAIGAFRELIIKDPQNPSFQVLLADALQLSAQAKFFQLEDTRPLFEEALAISDKILIGDPHNLEYRRMNERMHFTVGIFTSQLADQIARKEPADRTDPISQALPLDKPSRSNEALALCEQAHAQLHPLIPKRFELSGFTRAYQSHLSIWGEILELQVREYASSQQIVKVRELLERALSVWEEWAAVDFLTPEAQRRLHWIRAVFAESAYKSTLLLDLSKAENQNEARRLLGASLNALSRLPADLPLAPEIDQLTADIRTLLATLPSPKDESRKKGRNFLQYIQP
ncbi:MAG: serine/threonine protein kinase [Planctomycetia bacterium]|nr:serine/threonine protein kinase [Planctomycetia bacterium]